MYTKKLLFLLSVIFVLLFTTGYNHAASTDEKTLLVTFREKINEQLLTETEATVHHRYETIPTVALSIHSTQLKTLTQHPDIHSVENDHLVAIEVVGNINHTNTSEKLIENAHFSASEPTGNNYLAADLTSTMTKPHEKQWGLSRTNVNKAWDTNYRGNGIKIAIIDTGVDETHPDISIKDGVCFMTTSQTACENAFLDDNGHGTHVAGIIAGANQEKGYFGVVPEATIYAVKAMDAKGNGNTSDVIRGIEWALEKNVDMINLSLSMENSSTALKLALENAYSQGVLIVAAAGNNGNRRGTGDTVMYPARHDSVIAVGATNRYDERSNFSATGQTVEVSAPGETIYSTYPMQLYNFSEEKGYIFYSGTSMAAPFVTGILATYKQQNPDMTHEQLRALLHDNVIDLGREGKDPFFGHGLVQAVEGLLVATPGNFHLKNIDRNAVQLVWEKVEKAEVYQIFRDHKKIAETTETSFIDYVLEGSYRYDIKATSGHLTSFPTASEKIDVKGASFTDLANDEWYAPHILFLANRGIITGFGDNTARPAAEVTRAQAVAMIGRALRFEKKNIDTVFSDVDHDNFASGYIQQAFERDIVIGFPDGSFRPDQAVTRAEMALLISNAYNLESVGTSIFSDLNEEMRSFAAINSVAAAKITLGYPDGTFRPTEKMTRLQFAVFMARAEGHY